MNATTHSGVDLIVGGSAAGAAYAASRERIVGLLTRALGDEASARAAIKDERFESVVVRLSRSGGNDSQAVQEARRLFFGGSVEAGSASSASSDAFEILERVFRGVGGGGLAIDVLSGPTLGGLVAPVLQTHGSLAEPVRRLREAVFDPPAEIDAVEEEWEPCIEDAGLLRFTVPFTAR